MVWVSKCVLWFEQKWERDLGRTADAVLREVGVCGSSSMERDKGGLFWFFGANLREAETLNQGKKLRWTDVGLWSQTRHSTELYLPSTLPLTSSADAAHQAQAAKDTGALALRSEVRVLHRLELPAFVHLFPLSGDYTHSVRCPYL